MPHYLSKKQIVDHFKLALGSKFFNQKTDTAIICYDMDFFMQKIEELKNCFPADSLHAIAVKANPLPPVLRSIKGLGLGVEVASSGEIHLAEQCNFQNEKIIFDSPAKTLTEIQYALSKGYHLNIDSLSELQRIEKVLQQQHSKSNIGLRINPQIGIGTIEKSSVAGHYSKFGIPIKSNREKIKAVYQKNWWLNGIHCHIGSQGISLGQLVDGVKVIVELAEEINNKSQKQQIHYIDIGGGFPAIYKHDNNFSNLGDYAKALEQACPVLFGGKYKLITEFGRHLHVNAGFTASRIEYVKPDSSGNTLITHIGADLFVRECLNPEDWHHELLLLDKHGNIKKGKQKQRYNIAGPLCFSGDFIDKNVELPVAEEGDYLIIRDSGGYTFCMWSRYNSRQMPKILCIQNGEVKIIKQRENLDDMLRFWE
jgi:diaminopimelate decarboxylase